jgi:hypothetical protein
LAGFKGCPFGFFLFSLLPPQAAREKREKFQGGTP